jgi:hypothetical protein
MLSHQFKIVLLLYLRLGLKNIFLGFSDDEIRLDLQQQRIERAVSAELGKTAEVITKTGLFDTLRFVIR